MTDRELLELAAKAAGPLQGRHRAPIGEPAILCANDLYWCPLQDDGDALRLAVICGIDVVQHSKLSEGPLECVAWNKRMMTIQPYGTDPLAATRRAIVSAAAEIGKSMETQND